MAEDKYQLTLTGAQVDDALQQMNQRIPEGWAVGTKDGTPVSSTSLFYHNNAKYYAEQAQAEATEIGTSVQDAIDASAAAASAAQTATQKAADAAASAQSIGQAEQNAVAAADRAEDAADDAEYWAGQAAAVISGVASFNGRSGAVIPQAGDYTAAMVGAATESYVDTAIQNAIGAAIAASY